MSINPILQFEIWLNEAFEADLIEPNSFTLATVGNNMRPSQRVVLLKRYDSSGFLFFSNCRSKKVQQISQNSSVSAHFAWLGLERQLKIEGRVEEISKTKTFKYFMSSLEGNRVGNWIPYQGSIISSRTILEQKFDQMRKKIGNGELPFPDKWIGYIIKPTLFEFWEGSQDNLHDRFQYSIKDDNSWNLMELDS